MEHVELVKEHDRVNELQINDVRLATQLNSTQLLIEKLVDRIDGIAKDGIMLAYDNIRIKSYFIGAIFIFTPMLGGYSYFIEDKMKSYEIDNQNHYTADAKCEQNYQDLGLRLDKLEGYLNDKIKIY